MREADQAWPFKPGDVVRDSGEDGDDAAWLECAPVGTVVRDRRGIEWTMSIHPDVGLPEWRSQHAVGFCTAHGLSELGPLTVVSVPALASGGPVPDCCDHSARDEGDCADCLNTGHTHDPADPCPPGPQDTPQDAQNGTENSPTGVPGGERTSEGAAGASVKSLGDRLRETGDLVSADLPSMKKLLDRYAEEADGLARGGAELGRQIERYLTWVLDATDLHHMIDEDGDGDWEIVWERLAEMRPALERMQGELDEARRIAEDESATRIGLANRLTEVEGQRDRAIAERDEVLAAHDGGPVRPCCSRGPGGVHTCDGWERGDRG